jgi:hydrogenase-4 component I
VGTICEEGMMYREILKNMVSDKKPAEPYEMMEGNLLKMPWVDAVCDLCGRCARACSGKAITVGDDWSVDLGKCVFCRDCYESCKHIIPISAPNYALKRGDLIFHSSIRPKDVEQRLPEEKIRNLRNSVSIRELDTGSCNACEAEINAMSNKYYDMERFGLRIVASPRHADVLLVTGPMTRNMLTAAENTYSAVPGDKLVIASGTCAISGGLFVVGDVIGKGVQDTLPVDMYIVGCPPAPNRIVVSLIKALDLRH